MSGRPPELSLNVGTLGRLRFARLPAWITTTTAVVVVLALLSWLGGPVIGVRFVPSLLAWMPALVVGLV